MKKPNVPMNHAITTCRHKVDKKKFEEGWERIWGKKEPERMTATKVREGQAALDKSIKEACDKPVSENKGECTHKNTGIEFRPSTDTVHCAKCGEIQASKTLFVRQ